MTKEESTNIFVSAIISLSELCHLVKDEFFLNKLKKNLNDMSVNYINFSREVGQNVLQYSVFYEKAAESLDRLLELLEYIDYLNLIKPSPLFFEAKINLLNLKLQLARIKKDIPDQVIKKNNPEIKEEQKVSDKIKTEKSVNNNLKLNQSKKRIFDFIKISPNIRTKDIISEFSALSDRTVKRNLIDLLRNGLIKRRIDNKAVYYYVE